MDDEPRSAWAGKLVRLRALRAEDWTFLHSLDQDTESQRLGYRIPFPRNPEGTRKWAEERAAEGANGDRFFFVIETLEGETLGTLHVHNADRRNGTFEYGIDIARAARGRGYGSEAIRIGLRYYFGELGYQKANATVFSFNEPSQAMHRRLGFTEEGRVRRNIYANGTYHDEIWYGMTVEEFYDLYGR
jgi:RimJ/RimL family protein N-acetyltransferase